VKPRVLFVSRRVRMPLADGERRKWDAMRDEVDFRMLAAGVPDGREFRLVGEPRVLAGPAYYAALPQRIARELRDFRPHAVVAQGAHETAASLAARKLARVPAAVIADVHGDFRTPTRLYGSRVRSMLNPLADRVATTALRRADAVRTISDFTTGLVRGEGVEPTDVFPAYVDLTVFLEDPPAPLPDAPRALFVGVLQRYKNIDGLVATWRRVVALQPDARLLLVGAGRERALVEQLVRELPDNVTWQERLPQPEVKRALDESTLLVLPSRSEGLPRIVIEAFCRGRPVVGTRAGGIPDIVEHDVNGLLVDRGDTEGLAHAIIRLLTDASLAERLAQGAHASSDLWTMSPEEFARRVRELVERAAGLS
jgi:glycosyltransferase involved in cell wall biosynthesis